MEWTSDEVKNVEALRTFSESMLEDRQIVSGREKESEASRLDRTRDVESADLVRSGPKRTSMSFSHTNVTEGVAAG
jgi:hypothetical protein